MDVLYILGSGSKFKNNEIRYSLRTLEKFIPNATRVIVVGEDPGFLSKEVDFYPMPEAVGNKEYRIAKKIEWSCKKDVVTEPFLFMNDDFFLTQTINPETYPFYHKGQLNQDPPNNLYRKSLHNTDAFLRSQKKTTLHFDVHMPIIYDPEKFMQLASAWIFSKTLSSGLVVKSVYANTFLNPNQSVQINDVKLSKLKTPQDFKRLENRDVFSCSDAGWLQGVGMHLAKQFPNKSKYEK